MKYIFFILLVFATSALAQIYKWTDSAGQVHFSDKPNYNQRSEKLKLNTTPSNVPADSKSASNSKPVIMYSTSWCGYCKMARNYFRENVIAYTEYDIEKDAQAKSTYDSFGGSGVPVIFVGQERLNGFNSARFNEIYH